MSEEMWHVQIEPGDVKTVTLEQMDDMYRLELISASTLVWQPGMAKALPLSVIAGIDDEESDVMEIEPELIPEPVYSTRSVAPAPASVRYPTMPPPPAPVVAPMVAPVAYAPIAPAVAPVLRAPVAPVLASQDFYSPESLRPITMSDIPALRGRSGGNSGKILLGIAIAAGLLVTLYRNDLLRPMAASAGQTSAYEKLESALGAPGFGTPQQVTQLSSLLNPAVATDALSPTTTTTTTTTTPTTPSEETTDSTETTSATDSTPSETTSPAAVSKKPQTQSRKASAAPPRAKSQAPGKPMKAFKGSEYDPMNSKL